MIGGPPFDVPHLAMPEIVSQDVNGIEGQEIRSVPFMA
jgi:hypothetical protein